MSAKNKVLIVDDEEHNLDLAVRTFRDEFQVLTARDGQSGLALLAENPEVMLVISDQRMPGMSGVQFLSEVFRQSPKTVRVLMTAYSDQDAVIDAVNLGKIWSYVRKPVSIPELQGVVRASAELFHLAAENRQLLARLEQKNRELEEQKRLLELNLDERSQELLEANRRLLDLAARDGLTGLYNHRYFHERAAQEVSRARRYSSRVSLIFMDIDHFKKYNDTHGHPRGDELLKQMAKLLDHHTRLEDFRARVRETDLVARYGGEEFVVLLPETPKAGALIAAERLREAIAAFDFPGKESQPGGKVTVSLGVATYPDDADSKDALVVQADQALYAAKRDGRNCVRVA